MLLKKIYLYNLLCSPVFKPQIDGGVIDPPGFETENRSVEHWVAPECVAVAPTTFPPITATLVAVKVDGPVIVKVSKSSLNWKSIDF